MATLNATGIKTDGIVSTDKHGNITVSENCKRLVSPRGAEIVGTLEMCPGVSPVGPIFRKPNGLLDWDHTGGTKYWAEDQKTVTRLSDTGTDLEVVFVDDYGNEWLASELVEARSLEIKAEPEQPDLINVTETPSRVLLALMSEALDYGREAFEEDDEVDGGDMVEWFLDWRTRVAAAMDGAK